MIRSKQGTYYVTGCAHAPWHNKRMYDSVFDYIQKEVKLQGVILAGDIVDLNSLSSHDKGKAPLNGVTLDWEYEQASMFLDQIDMLGAKTTDYIYGNHCYDDATEFLTKEGFKHFDNLTSSDEIAQFDKNMSISFAIPSRFIKTPYKGQIYDITTPYTQQSVTDMHDVVLIDEGVLTKIKAKDLEESDLKFVPQQAELRQPEYPLSDDWLRLLTWVVCDATIVDHRKYEGEGSTKRRVQFKLSKQRKIQRLVELLDRMNVLYTLKECKKEGLNRLQPFYIRIYGDDARKIFELLGDKKQFPTYFKNLNKRQAPVVVDEIKNTDGHFQDGGVNWTTTSFHDIDTIAEMCWRNGILMNYRWINHHASGFKNAKPQLKARINTTNGGTKKLRIKKRDYDGMTFCVEMPLGTVVTRRNGKVAFSGNCDRYNRAMADADTAKLGSALVSPIEGLGLIERGYNVLTDWKNDTVKLGKHLDICHGEFLNVHSAKKTIDTYRKSTLYFHTHRFQIYMEGLVAGWNMGAGADFKAPIFGYATRAMKNSWVNASCLVTLDKDGYYHVEPLIYIGNKLIVNGRTY